jgi:septum formation protein
LILKKKIILASTSRYRAELLSRLKISFVTCKPDADESPLPRETPSQTALRLSVAKAKSVVADHPGALIIGSDQVAELDGQLIGKPGTRDAARRQLQAMRARSLVFHSGIALINSYTGRTQSNIVLTTVKFRNYSDAAIEYYVDHEDALDCAGSAKAEGLGIALIESMQSEDPTALIGLPIIALCTMLGEENYGVLA